MPGLPALNYNPLQTFIDPRQQAATDPTLDTASVGGFLQNAVGDVGNIAQQAIGLPGRIISDIQHPQQAGSDVTGLITGAAQGLNKAVGEPVATKNGQITGLQAPSIYEASQNFYQHPVGDVMTLDAAGNVVKGGIGKAINRGQAAEVTPSTPNVMTKLGNRVLAGQFKGAGKIIPNPASTVGKLADYGLTTPEQITNAAKKVTGSADSPEGQAVLTKAVDKAIKTQGSINMGEVKDATGKTVRPGMTDNQKALLDNSDFLSPLQKKNLQQKMVNAGIKSSTHGDEPMTGDLAGGDPEKLLSTLRAWESKLQGNYDIHGNLKPNLTPEEKDTARVYKGMVDDLKQRLFTDTGVGSQPLAKFLSPADIDTLRSVHPQLAKDATTTDVLGGRSLQSRFVQGNQMANLNAGEDEGAIESPGNVAGQAAFAFGHPIAGAGVMAANSPTGLNVIGNTLRTSGKIAGKIPTSGLKNTIQGVVGGSTIAGAVPSDSQNKQYNPNDPSHSAILTQINQQVNKDVPDPYAGGTAFTTTGAGAKYNQLKQEQASQKYWLDKNYGSGAYANSVDQQLAVLQNESTISSDIEKPYSVTKANDTQFLNAQYALQNTDPSILNRADWIQALKESNEPAYNALQGSLDALKGNIPGFDPSKVTNADAQSAISYLQSQQQQMLTNYQAFQSSYGNTPLANPNAQAQQPQAQPTGLPSNPPPLQHIAGYGNML